MHFRLQSIKLYDDIRCHPNDGNKTQLKFNGMRLFSLHKPIYDWKIY